MNQNNNPNENIDKKQYSREYLKYNTQDKQEEAMKLLYNKFNSNRLIQPLGIN